MRTILDIPPFNEAPCPALAATPPPPVSLPKNVQDSIFLWEHGTKIDPWPEPVDGQALLDTLDATVKRFVVLPKWAAETLALWILHTYAFLLRDVSTYVGLESPQKRCGKTTLLAVMCELVNRPVVASNISSPAFFRVIEEATPTLMIDEADTLLHGNDQLRGILNAGYYRKTAYVVRVDHRPAEPPSPGNDGVQHEHEKTNGENGDTSPRRPDAESGSTLARFSSWCPKMIATIKHLPETLRDRCIIIQMQRKTSHEKCERVKYLQGTDLRRKCARFVLDHAQAIAQARPDLPADLNDRAADIWEPLLALADIAGGHWPERARQAAIGLSTGAQDESPISSLLLDILVIFARTTAAAQEAAKTNGKPGHQPSPFGEGRIFSRDLIALLDSSTNRPWSELRLGKAVTELWLAKELRPFGIRPRTIWIGDNAAKGYVQEDFHETFSRYISKSAALALLEEARKQPALPKPVGTRPSPPDTRHSPPEP